MGTGVLPVISDDYRALNRRLLRTNPGYGDGGGRHAARVAAFADKLAAYSILDYGCGRGQLRKALWTEGWGGTIVEYDPAIPKKAELPTKRVDLVVCTDVLEHVEPELLDNVLADLRRLTKKGAYLSIATRPSNKTLPDGRNAHLLVQRPSWWMRQFHGYGWRVANVTVGYRKHSTEPRGMQLWLTV